MSWFAFPAGLFALLGVPAVLALHLYRSRHRKVPVSALFLWLDPESEDSAGRHRQPLRRTPSFWLEILAALLAGLFIAGFNPLDRAEARHLVVVLDDSASMGAIDINGQSAVDRARERMENAFDEYGRRLRITLVRSGRRPTLLCGPGALIPEARRVLQAWDPQAPSHDPQPALVLAKELAEGGSYWYLTDAMPSAGQPLDDAVDWIAVGNANGNLALEDCRRQRLGDDLTDRLQFTVRNFDERARTTQIRLQADGLVLSQQAVELEAGAKRSFTHEIPAGTAAVALQLDEDALAVDNQAVLYPLPERTVKIGIAIEEEESQALQLALLMNALPGVAMTADLGQADLVLAHERTPPPTWSLVIPRQVSDITEAEAFLQGFLPEKQHPLLDGVLLEGILWTRCRDFLMPGRSLLTVGDQPLLTIAAEGKTLSAYMNLLPLRSTLSRSPDWPIFLSNLVELRRASLPGPLAVNLVAGQSFRYLPRAAGTFQLLGPQRSRELTGDLLVVDDLAPYGDYRLLQGEQELVRFAVNFADPAESDLSGAHSGEHPPLRGKTEPAQQRYAESGFGRFLLLLLLLAIAADWLVIGGRPR